MLEAVPNASEGRDPAVIDRIAAAVDPVLFDIHTDAAHNRSVFTLFGTEADLFAAARRLFEAVLDSVHLNRHRGEHPRIGALDVLPFVPVAGTRMEDAVCLARRTGAALAGDWGVPVFLYGQAATDRRPLREIRRGGAEGLRQRMSEGAALPDYGPPRLHPTAGAVAVGARQPLVAFNVNLDSADSGAARSIAATVRKQGGGLPGVRALGVLVRVRDRAVAQVTMNVERVEETPLSLVFARVREAARQRGMEVLGSEIVGLVPEDATWPGMVEDLQLPAPPRTIEQVLAARRRGRRQDPGGWRGSLALP